MEKEKKIYCGSGKKQNETWFKANLKWGEKAKELFNKHAKEYMGMEYVPIHINITQPDKYGKTVSISIDISERPASNEPTNRPVAKVPDTSNLPF
jgi:hypothetical protein